MRKFLKSKIVRVIGIIAAGLAAIVIAVMLSEGVVRDKVPVSLSSEFVFTDFWDRGYVTYKGTWIIEGQKQYSPLQTSEARCSLHNKTCVEGRAEVFMSLLTQNLDFFEIVEWDKNTIVFKNDEPECVDYIYTINRHTKQVSGVRKRKSDTGGCATFDKELRIRLANGFDVYWDLQREARPLHLLWPTLIIILLMTVIGIWRVFVPRVPINTYEIL